MAKRQRACKECGRLTAEEICIYCKAPTSEEWFGFAQIISPENSEIARRLGVNTKGMYALRVR